MNTIGIIVNPFSGKDLRRLTAQATTVGHGEKASKVIRMINAMKRFGIEKVFLMPDSYSVNSFIAATVNNADDSPLRVEVLNFDPTDQPEDTVRAVEMMDEIGVDCIIVLGGDGTSRLVAKVDSEIPMIPVSTGTNNAYPRFWEGTTVGIAAAFISQKGMVGQSFQKDKRIEIEVNNKFADIALVDAVITNIPYVGSRVVCGIEEVQEIIVCRCSPEQIGFSSLVGTINLCEDSDDFGYRLKLNGGGIEFLAPVNSGQLAEISYSDLTQMQVGDGYHCHPDYDGTLALDGERTVPFRQGDQITFTITRNGPRKVDVREVLVEAVNQRFFHVEH